MSRELDMQLLKAVKRGSLADVKKAVESGANVNATGDGQNQCFYVLNLLAGNPYSYTWPIIEYLVEQGADVNIQSPYGYFPLMLAAGVQNPNVLEIMECFLSHGANVNAQGLGGQNEMIGNTALMQALKYKGTRTLGVVESLVKHGADIHVKTRHGETALTIALRKYSLFASQKRTPIDILLEDVLPKDFMPRPKYFMLSEKVRGNLIARIVDLLDTKGISYAKRVADDMKENGENLTRTDIEALEPVVRKLSMMDWMNDAQVASGDFEIPDIAR